MTTKLDTVVTFRDNQNATLRTALDRKRQTKVTDTATISPETITLKYGSHANPEQGMCFMEAVAFFAGETHSYRPQCVDPAFNFLVGVNDRLSDESRQLLKPYILRIAGTKGTDEHEVIRRAMLSTWAFKLTAQRAEDAGLTELATAFRALPDVTKDNVASVHAQLRTLRGMAWAERNKQRCILADKIKAELAKRGLPAAAVADADADAAADADAVAVAAAAAAAAAAAVAVADADADAAAAAAAVAVADADADADAAAVAAAAAAAAAAWQSWCGPKWYAVRKATYDKLLPVYKERYAKHAESNLASMFELLDKMIAVHHVAIEPKRGAA